jgi:hypothetical protein
MRTDAYLAESTLSDAPKENEMEEVDVTFEIDNLESELVS